MTPELIAACVGGPVYLAKRYAVHLAATTDEFEINTLTRQAAYFAQIGHESDGLLFFAEVWGPTEAQIRYEPPSELAKRLGNTEPGDGRRFAGRGPIQITGRYNYRVMGGLLGFDLEKNPELLDDPELACRSSGAFWKMNHCNDFADSSDFVGLTRRINGGTNGLADRLKRWVKAKAALGIT